MDRSNTKQKEKQCYKSKVKISNRKQTGKKRGKKGNRKLEKKANKYHCGGNDVIVFCFLLQAQV